MALLKDPDISHTAGKVFTVFILSLFLICTLISAAASLKYLFSDNPEFAPAGSCDPPPILDKPADPNSPVPQQSQPRLRLRRR